MHPIIQQLEREALGTQPRITFRTGDTVQVAVRIGEGDRIQVFEGVVIRISRGLARTTFTVRKISHGGIGVERIFPILSPTIDSIKVVGRSRVRRSRLYYQRTRFGRAAKLKELRFPR
jgi:large subunit ribosomal protein L19